MGNLISRSFKYCKNHNETNAILVNLKLVTWHVKKLKIYDDYVDIYNFS